MKSAFDDSEQYELTALGEQFVHYAMTEVTLKITYGSDDLNGASGEAAGQPGSQHDFFISGSPKRCCSRRHTIGFADGASRWGRKALRSPRSPEVVGISHDNFSPPPRPRPAISRLSKSLLRAC